jgi:hypothetical protein
LGFVRLGLTALGMGFHAPGFGFGFRVYLLATVLLVRGGGVGHKEEVL